jgi:hypothetical protein
MAKNTTKKIKELKAEKPSKITNEELNQVQSVINNINRVQMEIGSIESKKHSLLHGVAELQEKLHTMQKKFMDSYGTSDINVQNGTINYKKDEQTD